MSLLPSRTSLFDDLFRDMASGFYIRPLHGVRYRARSGWI